MTVIPFTYRRLAVLFFLCLLPLSGCAGRVSTAEIRSSYGTGSIEPLRTEMEKTHAAHGEMVTALNLARVCQLGGHWRESIRRYEEAQSILEEYESRAVISVRALAADAGTVLFTRGAKAYYGTGFERSLLHTFNALNYLMLGDFDGAAVEIRRMEKRQEYWLEEAQARIERHMRSAAVDSPDDLPAGYSMRDLLRDEAVRGLLNSYQDAFSYALAAILHRIAGDSQAAEVSMRRAVALDENAARLFRAAWAAPEKLPARGKAKKSPDKTPKATTGETPVETPDVLIAVPPLPPRLSAGEIPLDAPSRNLPETQEVTVLAFTGLAPALGVEHVRLWFPAIGYLLVDLPAYTRPLPGAAPETQGPFLENLVYYPLLRTDVLAYRTLWDEVRMETASAFSRAAVRAGVAAAAYAAAASHKDTKDFAPLVGGLTTVMFDLFSVAASKSVRNWETLPNTGYIAMTKVPRGSTVRIGSGRGERAIYLPEEARGGIIVVTQLSNNTTKVNYVTY